MCQLHLYAGTDAPLNVTFLRAPSHALLKVNIPRLQRRRCVAMAKKREAKIHGLSLGYDYEFLGDGLQFQAWWMVLLPTRKILSTPTTKILQPNIPKNHVRQTLSLRKV
ncbi:hypothetical protein ACOSQ2_011039 [Xanthoceras sorbifolium]